jgi:hypothetical protein
MSIEGPVFITPHAVRQFQARIAPAMTFDAARTALIEGIVAHAVSVRPTQNRRGVTIRVRGGRHAFRAVVMPPVSPGLAPAVVTVLRAGS